MHNKPEYQDKGFKALEQLWRIRNQLQITNNWKCIANLVESTEFCSFAINSRRHLRLAMFDIAVAYRNGQQKLLKQKLFQDSLREVDTNIKTLQNLLYNPPKGGADVDEVDNVDTRSSSVVPSNTSHESVSSAQPQTDQEPEFGRVKRPNEPDNTVQWSVKLSDSFNKTSITIATSTTSQHSSQSSQRKKKVKRFKDTRKVKRQQTGVPKIVKQTKKSKTGRQSPWKPSSSHAKKEDNLGSKVVSMSQESLPRNFRQNTESFRHFLPKLSHRGSQENTKSAYIAKWAKNVSAESKTRLDAPSPPLRRGVTIHLPQIEKQSKVELKLPPESKPESEKGLRQAFEFIKNNIGDRWKTLARHLPYTPSRSLALLESDIKDIERRYTRLSEQAYQSLLHWYKHSTDHVRESISILINTLSEVGEGRIAMHVRAMFGLLDNQNS